MYNINDTLTDYVNRLFGVMNICIDDPKITMFLKSAQNEIKQQKMADFEAHDLEDIFTNISWVKDTKLAKEFQEFYSLMGFKKMSSKPEFDGQCYFPLEKLYDGLNFKFGFMYLDSHYHPLQWQQQLYFIISGTTLDL